MSVIALFMVVIVLAAAFAYYYVTTGSEVSTLKGQVSTLEGSGHSFCLTLAAEVSSLGTTLSNITETLQQQVQGDNSMIAALNSTKPAGYEGMTATLDGQIKEDLAIINQIMSFSGPGISSTNNFCSSVSQP